MVELLFFIIKLKEIQYSSLLEVLALRIRLKGLSFFSLKCCRSQNRQSFSKFPVIKVEEVKLEFRIFFCNKGGLVWTIFSAILRKKWDIRNSRYLICLALCTKNIISKTFQIELFMRKFIIKLSCYKKMPQLLNMLIQIYVNKKMMFHSYKLDTLQICDPAS